MARFMALCAGSGRSKARGKCPSKTVAEEFFAADRAQARQGKGQLRGKRKRR